MSLMKGKVKTCKRLECGLRVSNHRDVSYCSNMCNLKDLQAENALLTIKNKGLEDIDEISAGYRDLAARMIKILEEIGHEDYSDDFQKELEEVGE